jgi:alkanesulfonate monooxygenase SsuD/methylene tetrahydromethanopterin reductase-like flavin-dependent oxidoreductase (luciferase family)
VPDYGHELEFGIFVTAAATNAERAVAHAVLADELGLDLVAVQDHPYQPRLLDAWTLLSFVAARTNRIRLTTDVLNLPLRPPAVVARAVAALDILSGGRAELGIGAGSRWDSIEEMGGRRLRPGQSVEALEEAVELIRSLWDVDASEAASFEGDYYRLGGAERGPAPQHPIKIWIGAYKPRMLNLVGRKADGWLPSTPYLQPGDLAAGNAAIDDAAESAGRDPRDIRRLLNIGPAPAEDLTKLAVEDGISTFVLIGDDEAVIRTLAEEIAPAVREQVASERSRRR